MDPVTQALRDPTLTESLEDDMASTGACLVDSLHGHARSGMAGPPGRALDGTLTIDLDLPPVHAVEPAPKGPRWRLQALRESWERVKGKTP